MVLLVLLLSFCIYYLGLRHMRKTTALERQTILPRQVQESERKERRTHEDMYLKQNFSSYMKERVKYELIAHLWWVQDSIWDRQSVGSKVITSTLFRETLASWKFGSHYLSSSHWETDMKGQDIQFLVY